MKKRGPIVIVAGAALVGLAFFISHSIMENAGSSLVGNSFLPSPESMFDKISEKETIFPGMTYTFTHTTSSSQVPLMWGVYVTDYRSGDRLTIDLSNSSGTKLASYDDGDPILIKSFMIPRMDTYSFEVQNTGSDSLTAEMLFTENPEKSKALTNPNSPFNKNIVPLAVAGFMLIFGIIMIIAGIILGILDWRKSKNQSRYI